MNDGGNGQRWRMEVHNGALRAPIAETALGRAEIAPSGAFEAGSYTSFTLTYTCGLYGIDDSGALRVCFRFASDQSDPQFEDPAAPNYTTVEASNRAVLLYRFDSKGNVRPWDRTLYIKVIRGFLQEGDTITVRFGVTEYGSPGMRLQTFCEDTFEFRVLVDPIATYNFQTLPSQPVIAIVPGPPERYVAVVPSLRRTGEKFALKLKGEDRWGNPSDRCDTTLSLRPSGPIEGLPETVTLRPGTRAFTVEGLCVQVPGDYRISVIDDAGVTVAETNPLRIVADAPLVLFWGDLHGQTEETIGTGSAQAYFAFARDLAFVDACGHQGNDFQITQEFWKELNRLTATFDAPGEFIALPGYEWSGNTSLGGDRNVYFPDENHRIRRSSHALIEDMDDRHTDCPTAAALFQALADDEAWDVVCFAHCGGRYADIKLAHDGRFERSIEVHSSWGTFEWLIADAFEAGYRVGIVGNSDGHKGRPGASYPGAGKFGAIGGLTGYLMPELTREHLLDCLRKRRHYATTGGPGGRMIIDVQARFDGDARIFHDDPALRPAASHQGHSALMGDIVHSVSGEMELDITIISAAPIERVDLFNGLEHIETIRPYHRSDLGGRIRVVWEGAEYRGRSREVVWDGTAKLAGNTIKAATPVNFLNNDKTLDIVDRNRLAWKSLTTGNFSGFDMIVTDADAGRLQISTPLIKVDLSIDKIGFDDQVFDASDHLPRFMKVFRLPEQNLHRQMQFTRKIKLRDRGDNPIYIRLTQEDGTRAWTSPIYVFR
jgi:hypothetical protein